jgi:orotidine-5'-phosphate decarboxylase
MDRRFMDMLQAAWASDKFVCVGLDTDATRIRSALQSSISSDGEAIFEYNRRIIDSTADVVCAYKPNSAFYEASGVAGIQALISTIEYILSRAPEVPVILDAKRGDIGSTNQAYARFAFDICGADAVTVQPYAGKESLTPFLERADKGVIVLTRTSNPGANEFQDASVGEGRKLYELVAEAVTRDWNQNRNCGLVAGAPYPEEMRRIRSIVGDLPLLVPGVGTQGGELEAVVEAGQDSHGQGMIINSSRAILFASSGPDFAQAARQVTLKLHERILACRQRLNGLSKL